LPVRPNFPQASAAMIAASEVAAKFKEPNTADRKFEDVVKDVEAATVLVLVD
jgi:hypothetical protein